MCMACLTACHDDNGGEDNTGNARTVLIYMSGENNLASLSYLHMDLQEIIKGSKSLAKNQRLFVFVDSLNKSGQPAVNPYLMEVHGGKGTVVHQYDKEYYACDPAFFREVIQRVVMELAPADSYGLVLWGHASGWAVSSDTIASSARGPMRAYGQDTGTDGNRNGTKWMNITQMAKAMEGLPKMEFIFADCCNMMCAEVGYELRNVTNYLMGSPAEIPGDGAPYDLIIPLLYQSNGQQMCRNVIDTYYDYYGDVFYSVPLSVIDTRHIEQLAEATRNVLEKFDGGYPQYPAYPDLTADSIAYYWHYDSPIMYDMRAFIKTHVSDDVFQQWDKVYQLAVPYYRMALTWMTIYRQLESAFWTFSKDESRYGCVSMFIPMNTPYYSNSTFRYNKTYNNYGWNRVIDWSRFGWE